MYTYLRKNFFSNSLSQIFFITLCLLSLVTLGTVFFKYIILSIFFLSIFYIEFKSFNKFAAIINFIAILIILISTKLSTMNLIFCFFLFYGFFKFRINLINTQLLRIDKNKFYLIIIIFFFISIFYNLKPQQDNYFIYLTQDEVAKISNGKYKNDEIIVNKYLVKKNQVFNEICVNNNYKDEIVIKNKCINLFNFVKLNRISINNLDPNLFSLILFFIVIFFLKINIPEKKIILFFVSFISFLIIEYLTKSRVLIVYYSLYIFFEYFIKNKHINFFRVFLSFNIALYLFAFLFNYQFSEYDTSSYTNPFFRLIDLFDESLKIRFSNISNSIIYQIQNLNEIILPGSIEHFNATQSINKFNNYSPHNLLLALIKDYGLIVALIMILNIKYLYDENFSNNFLSLLLSLGFLGYSILFIYIFILFERIFNFRK